MGLFYLSKNNVTIASVCASVCFAHYRLSVADGFFFFSERPVYAVGLQKQLGVFGTVTDQISALSIRKL
jgi:hypothetical protein